MEYEEFVIKDFINPFLTCSDLPYRLSLSNGAGEYDGTGSARFDSMSYDNGTGFGCGQASGYSGDDVSVSWDGAYGFGTGYPGGIKSFNGMPVYAICHQECIFRNIVSKNVASGYILNNDLTLSPYKFKLVLPHKCYGSAVEKIIDLFQKGI